MTRHKTLVALGVLTLASAAALRGLPAHARHTSMNGGPVADCAALHMTFDGREGVVLSDERLVTRAEAATLRVRADPNAGVQVQGWDKDDYFVSLCKATAAGPYADERLSEIKLSVRGGEVTVTGVPRDRNVATYLLIQAPRAAALDLSAVNGPLSLYRVDGTIHGHVTNGPASAEGCKGEIDLSAENGPVSSVDSSGHLRLLAKNGPVSVALRGETWSGSGLEARAENGPLTVSLPSGYKSGVLVESDGHGPLSCTSICSEARRTSDKDSMRIEFGSGPTKVHLSVGNGPLSLN